MYLRANSFGAAAAAIVCAVALLVPTTAPAKRKKPKPRVSVTAWSIEPLGSKNTVAPGGTMRICGTAATTTTKIYAYLKFNHLRKGRKVESKWTYNGVFYAGIGQTWNLASPGRAAAAMARAPSQTRFPSGLYRFSLNYGGHRVVSSSLTVSSDC